MKKKDVEKKRTHENITNCLWYLLLQIHIGSGKKMENMFVIRLDNHKYNVLGHQLIAKTYYDISKREYRSRMKLRHWYWTNFLTDMQSSENLDLEKRRSSDRFSDFEEKK